jgi:SAM-dependent methyltransferase
MFKKYLTFPKSGYVLEIGSGVSGPIYFVSKAGVTKIAIDPYLGILKIRSRHVEKIRSVGEYLPLRTGTIDVIFLHNALDHAFKPRSVMEESRRVSKGDVFILARIFDRLVLMILGKLLSRFDHGHPNHLTADGVLRLVSSCALQPRLVETYWGDHSKVPLLRLLRLGRIKRALSVLIQKRIVIVASPAEQM